MAIGVMVAAASAWSLNCSLSLSANVAAVGFWGFMAIDIPTSAEVQPARSGIFDCFPAA